MLNVLEGWSIEKKCVKSDEWYSNLGLSLYTSHLVVDRDTGDDGLTSTYARCTLRVGTGTDSLLLPPGKTSSETTSIRLSPPEQSRYSLITNIHEMPQI
jgi:hypothetical protein